LALPFYTVIGCHRLPTFRGLHGSSPQLLPLAAELTVAPRARLDGAQLMAVVAEKIESFEKRGRLLALQVQGGSARKGRLETRLIRKTLLFGVSSSPSERNTPVGLYSIIALEL
jgi:hypothetical protein